MLLIVKDIITIIYLSTIYLPLYQKTIKIY